MRDAEKSKEALLAELRSLRQQVAELETGPRVRMGGIATDITERKRGDKALPQSKERFHTAFKYAATGKAFVSTDLHFQEVNQALCRMFGYTEEELLAMTVMEVTYPDDRALGQAEIRQMLVGELESAQIEKRYVTKQGSILWGLLSITLVRDAHGPGIDFLAELRDITERKQAEEELQQSEARYHALVEHAPEAIVVLDVEGGCFVDCNSNAEALFGLSREALLQTGPVALSPETQPDGRRSSEAAYEEIMRAAGGEVRAFEWVHCHSEGQEILCEVRLVRLPSAGRVLVRGSFNDITEHKRAEEALRESEEKFSKAFQAAPDIMTIATLDEGRFVEVNDSFEHLSGYRREEVIGRAALELNIWVDPDDRARIVEMLQAEGHIRNLEIDLLRKSGEVRQCQFSADIIEVEGVPCVLALTKDITERKQVEEALRASEEKFGKAFHASPDAVTITRQQDGHFLETNEGFERLTGYKRAEAIGKSPDDLNLWAPGLRDRTIAALKREGRIHERLLKIRRKSGEMRDCLLSMEMIEVGSEVFTLSVVHDVTEKMQAEAEREQLIEKLEAKNAELERFTYTVSHDLKSPLVTIKGFLGLLEQDVAQGNLDRVRQDVSHINAAADKMARLLDELLELSRIGRLMNPPEEVSLTDLAQEAAQMVAGQIAARGVTVEIDSLMPVVFGDRMRLLEVYQNLLENAVKFMGDQAVPRVEIGLRQENGEDLWYVRDNGLGIDPRYHEKIFGLFERLDARGEGTGIGLALVKRIVEVHGGRIWVESEGEGHGSTFCFTLPSHAL